MITRREEVKILLDAASELGPDERSQFLERACGDNVPLRREVESLLEFYDQGLKEGQRVGSFLVVRELARGGMGIVYLGRREKPVQDVAIKVLRGTLDDGLVDRFRKEGEILAKISHPHIATFLDAGRTEKGLEYLVTDYVEGETLEKRLKTGPLSPDLALRYGLEIADALEKAHSKGIVHRDVKPGNIMLTASGSKLLDFGLAKLSPVDASGQSSERLTDEGTILGTLNYMSPEQLEGGEVDARCDIFALGGVLYEMLAGTRAFEGNSRASVIGAILKDEPQQISTIQRLVPRGFEPVIRKCLAKDPARRWQTMGELKRELERIPERSLDVGVAPVQRANGWRQPVAVGLAASTAFVAGGLATWILARPLPDGLRAPTRLVVTLPPDQNLLSEPSAPIAISPDGKVLVYAAAERGRRSLLYRRSMDQFEFSPIRGTENATLPFFSPDGRWIGFVADGLLKKVSTDGGAPVTVATASRVTRGATWTPSDQIIFAGDASGLLSVAATGGEPTPLTIPDAEKGEIAHALPSVLPDGRSVLFTVETSDYPRVAVLSLETGRWETLLPRSTEARYLRSGHLVYVQDGALLAVSFDAIRQRIMGTPVALLDGVYSYPGLGNAYFAVSESGTLVYVVGSPDGVMVWVDREGRTTQISSEQRSYWYPRLSPDGSRIAVDIRSGTSRDIWIYDVETGTRVRLTTEGTNILPVWTPDGSRVAFASNRSGGLDLHWKAADGSGNVDPLLVRPGSQFPLSWSPDAKHLAFHEITRDSGRDICVLTLDEKRSVACVVKTDADERSAVFSPNGRWLAYVSDESGEDEVYVLSFEGTAARWPISVGGGREPVWSRDGSELFYRQQDVLMSVSVDAGPVFAAGKPRRLFEGHYDVSIGGNQNYDVTPDGLRFAMVRNVHASAPTELHVVLNWFEELKMRMPSN